PGHRTVPLQTGTGSGNGQRVRADRTGVPPVRGVLRVRTGHRPTGPGPSLRLAPAPGPAPAGHWDAPRVPGVANLTGLRRRRPMVPARAECRADGKRALAAVRGTLPRLPRAVTALPLSPRNRRGVRDRRQGLSPPHDYRQPGGADARPRK